MVFGDMIKDEPEIEIKEEREAGSMEIVREQPSGSW